MENFDSRNRGPRAKSGRTRMRTGEYAVDEYRGIPLIQLIAILVILGLLSVVAIPRYIDTRNDRHQEAREVAAHSYMRALHSALTVNTANHYLRGAEWVDDGEKLMGLLEEGWKMPQGMHYHDNVWIDEKTGMKWEFNKASQRLPPRIKRVQQRPPPEAWEMEPIGKRSQTAPPKS